MQEYTGPIERGMRFLWEPMKPHATEHLIVIERKINSDDEMWITTRSWVATSKVTGDYTGETCYNDESRFREAVMLVVDEEAEDIANLEDAAEKIMRVALSAMQKYTEG